MTRPTHEIDAYLDGEPTPDQVRALQAWIQADRANAKQFLAAIRLHQQIGTQLRKDRFDLALQSSTQSATTKDGDAAIQALAELARLHDEGLKQPSDPELHNKQRIHHAHAGQAQPLRLKTKLILTGSLAACIALAGLAVLIVNLFTGPEQEIADQTDDTLAVATLTAERDAKWAPAGGASAPPANLSVGTKLHPNHTLTLTAGFAEITTARGAIAILEAPATIELLDNNNALQLHSGKLVGSCYSESSKGFVVKTDHADITDIGTEFGVQVQADRVTATVITGEIEMNVPGSAPQRLTQDQTAQLRVNGVNRKLEIQDQLAQGFEALLPRRRLADALRNDPAMIAYWGFEAEDIVDGRLLNRATATQGKMDGTLGQPGKPDSSPTLTEGRSPGTGALRFEAEEFDLVRISQDDAKAIDGLEQFTIGVWVKPDHMDQMSHHLVTKRARDGLNLGLCWDGRPGGDYARNTVFFEGRMGQSNDAEADSLHRRSAWMHLVVMYDRGERSIYLDGALIERLPRQDAGRLATIDAELLIGAATPHLNETGAYLDGDLDELFILSRAMSPDEIATLYETGVAQP